MRLIIFGATGNTGLQFVTQALERGHEVTAFVRDPARLDITHEHLSVVQGDIKDKESIERALANPVDAVVCALGIFNFSPSSELSDGTKRLIDVMEKRGVRRLAVVTSLGVGDSKGQGNFVARCFQKLSLRQVLADKERQESHIRNSSLQWTIARPARLTDGAGVRHDLVQWQGPTPKNVKFSWAVSRASVAGFLLDALENGTHFGQAISLSDPR
jgi:putative NADH-flavin reductase